jgi:hypothetical protein
MGTTFFAGNCMHPVAAFASCACMSRKVLRRRGTSRGRENASDLLELPE